LPERANSASSSLLVYSLLPADSRKNLPLSYDFCPLHLYPFVSYTPHRPDEVPTRSSRHARQRKGSMMTVQTHDQAWVTQCVLNAPKSVSQANYREWE